MKPIIRFACFLTAIAISFNVPAQLSQHAHWCLGTTEAMATKAKAVLEKVKGVRGAYL